MKNNYRLCVPVCAFMLLSGFSYADILRDPTVSIFYQKIITGPKEINLSSIIKSENNFIAVVDGVVKNIGDEFLHNRNSYLIQNINSSKVFLKNKKTKKEIILTLEGSTYEY